MLRNHTSLEACAAGECPCNTKPFGMCTEDCCVYPEYWEQFNTTRADVDTPHNIKQGDSLVNDDCPPKKWAYLVKVV